MGCCRDGGEQGGVGEGGELHGLLVGESGGVGVSAIGGIVRVSVGAPPHGEDRTKLARSAGVRTFLVSIYYGPFLSAKSMSLFDNWDV